MREYPNVAYTLPKHDPRILNPSDSLWGAIGVFGCLFAILLAVVNKLFPGQEKAEDLTPADALPEAEKEA